LESRFIKSTGIERVNQDTAQKYGYISSRVMSSKSYKVLQAGNILKSAETGPNLGVKGRAVGRFQECGDPAVNVGSREFCMLTCVNLTIQYAISSTVFFNEVRDIRTYGFLQGVLQFPNSLLISSSFLN
jgi:hypothetical protein